MIIKLKNGTAHSVIESECSSSRIVANFNSVEEIEAFRLELTQKNLSSFNYLDSEDGKVIIGTYENYKFEQVYYAPAQADEDGNFKAWFEISPLSDIEIRLTKLEESQEYQDEAINELAIVATPVLGE